MYLVYHTRFNGGADEYQIRIHQMFINEDGWPVVAPYEYSGDKISKYGYSKNEIAGNYQFIIRHYQTKKWKDCIMKKYHQNK